MAMTKPCTGCGKTAHFIDLTLNKQLAIVTVWKCRNQGCGKKFEVVINNKFTKTQT
jgi:hypothetical protein